ncbi:MAG: hypothetical protein FWF38_01585 [Spirochaetaceae bacterium]|nr:hypothetical protein [Spirochaetaceae bacterium]
MKTKKTVFVILVFLIFAAIISADEFNREYRDPNGDIIFIDTAPLSPKSAPDKSDTKPNSSEVVIVASATLSPTPNNAFFTKYNTINSAYNKRIINSKTYNGVITPTIYIILGKFDRKEYVTAIYHLGDDSEINCIKTQIPRDRVIKIDQINAYLADMEIFGLTLPVGMEFSLPEKVNYVYIGSFVYEWEGYDFKIKNIQQIDDYDNAAKFIAEKYGTDAKLERVSLRKITKEKK